MASSSEYVKSAKFWSNEVNVAPSVGDLKIFLGSNECFDSLSRKDVLAALLDEIKVRAQNVQKDLSGESVSEKWEAAIHFVGSLLNSDSAVADAAVEVVALVADAAVEAVAEKVADAGAEVVAQVSDAGAEAVAQVSDAGAEVVAQVAENVSEKIADVKEQAAQVAETVAETVADVQEQVAQVAQVGAEIVLVNPRSWWCC